MLETSYSVRCQPFLPVPFSIITVTRFNLGFSPAPSRVTQCTKPHASLFCSVLFCVFSPSRSVRLFPLQVIPIPPQVILCSLYLTLISLIVRFIAEVQSGVAGVCLRYCHISGWVSYRIRPSEGIFAPLSTSLVLLSSGVAPPQQHQSRIMIDKRSLSLLSDLTPEEQQLLLDIRRKKAQLLQEIQVSE